LNFKKNRVILLLLINRKIKLGGAYVETELSKWSCVLNIILRGSRFFRAFFLFTAASKEDEN